MSDLNPIPSAIEQARACRIARASITPDEEWPELAWQDYLDRGILKWTIPVEYGGFGLAQADVLAGCIELARTDLVPAFVLSQFQSAITRLVAAGSEGLREWWLPRLADGQCLTTVGISHLSTSRQHVAQPIVTAEETSQGYRLTGLVPWVTGGAHADLLVTGAVAAASQQILVALPMSRPGISVGPHERLVALTGSHTGTVKLEGAEVSRDEILAGPAERVMQTGSSGGAGSLTTSCLALGHARHCIDFLDQEVAARPVLAEIVEAFKSDADVLQSALLETAAGMAGISESPETLRARTTALALSASQAYLTASKGSGFIAGRPAERFAREALFFLVWSCPQAVSSRLLREFSGCEDE